MPSVTEFKFKQSNLAHLPAPDNGARIEYRDADCPGLRLRVSRSSRTFYFLGRCRAIGTNIRVLIGPADRITLSEARAKSMSLAAACARGENPLEAIQTRKAELTFDELFTSYMAQHARPHKRTADEDEDKYRRHVAATLARLPLSRLTVRDIAALHSRVTRDAGPTTANRVHSLILGVFNWSIRHGITTTNPAKGVKRNRELSRERYVREDEMPHFLRAAQCEPCATVGDLFQVCLFTGQRIGNVLAMRWAEVNLDAAIWTIPRTKNGRPLTVALIPQAVAVLRRRLTDRESEFVFPGSGPKGHLVEPKKGWQRVIARAECYRLALALVECGALSESDAAHMCDRAIGRPVMVRSELRALAGRSKLTVEGMRTDDLRIHDLRRTLGSWLAMNGASQWVIGKVLGHQSPQSSAPYARVGLGAQMHWLEATVGAMERRATQGPIAHPPLGA
jgi:integrase